MGTFPNPPIVSGTPNDGDVVAFSAALGEWVPVPQGVNQAAVNASVNAAVNALVNGAPGALDTLKELADAINDDASFAATVTAALAAKQPLDADLTEIAALVTTSFGRSLLTQADAAAVRTAIGAQQTGSYASVTPITASGASTASADNTAAVNAAIAAAGVNGSVYVPSGTFLCEGPVVPLSGQRITGPGTLKRTAASTHHLITCTSVSDVLLDVTLDGNMPTLITGNPGVGATGTGTLVTVTGCTFVTVRGKLQNNQGAAITIIDSSFCRAEADIYNMYLYGVVIGSQGSVGDPGGVCNYNSIRRCTIELTGKDSILFSGHTDSTASPNDIYGNSITGVTIIKPGDSGIELGLGTHGSVVDGVTIDAVAGSGFGYNGIIIRDGTGHSISNFTIRNFPTFSNGNGVYLTLGNGVFVWPAFTGVMTDLSIGPGVIENCSRGVFLQGNNTSASSTNNFTGGAGSGGQTYAGITVTGVVVAGTQLGTYTGITRTITGTVGTTNGSTSMTDSGASFTNADVGQFVAMSQVTPGTYIVSVTNSTTVVLSIAATATTAAGTAALSTSPLANLCCHGFYVQSVSEVTLTNCIAKGCQNDGFRIGDNFNSGSYVTDATLSSCRAFNNGQQKLNGQVYAGFNLLGTSNQAKILLTGCQGSDHQGTRSQNYGFSWNGLGSGGQTQSAALVNCTGGSNLTGLFNNIGTAPATTGTITVQAGTYTIAATDATVIYTGAGGHTHTLPSVTFGGAGRRIFIRNQGSGALTVAKSGGGTLSTTSLAAGAEHIFETDGTNWY